MCHAERAEVVGVLAGRGFIPVDARSLGAPW